MSMLRELLLSQPLNVGLVTDAYRKSHEIEGSTEGAQEDYQVPIKVHYGDAGCFAENGVDEPLYFQNYPRAVYYNGKTYMVWQGDAGYDPYIICYDHATDTWSDAVKVGTNPLSGDYHGAPVILIDNSGYIHIFYGCHVTNLKYAKSDNPEDITAWTAQADPTTMCTYPNVTPDNGSIHLIYRHTVVAQLGNLAYRLSDDNGASWGAETIIIETEVPANDGIYAYMPQLDGTKLHIIWRYYTPNGVGNPQNVYHAYLELSDGHMYSMDGTDLGTSITKAEADANCLVVDSGDYLTFQMAQHIDENGYPYIIYCIETVQPLAEFDINFTRWNGSSWVASETIAETDEALNGMDFILHSSTSITAFLNGSGAAGRGGDIVKWSWNGTSWSEVETILSEAKAGMPLISPKVVVNYDEELQLIFTEYGGVDVTGLKVYSYPLQDSGKNVSCHGKCKTDFGDIRFMQGEVELDYWLEEKVDGYYASFWVEIPDIPADPDSATIYIYYGNADAVTQSDGSSTFPILFDDIEDGDVSDWTVAAPSTAVADGTIKEEGDYSIKFTRKAGGSMTASKLVALTGNWALELQLRPEDIIADKFQILIEKTAAYHILLGTKGATFFWYDGADHTAGVVAVQFYLFQVYFNSATKKYDVSINGTSIFGPCNQLGVAQDTFDTINIAISNNDKSEWWDAIRIRQWAIPEPANGDWGSEEDIMWPF